jgi:hypothetical protein
MELQTGGEWTNTISLIFIIVIYDFFYFQHLLTNYLYSMHILVFLFLTYNISMHVFLKCTQPSANSMTHL